MLRSYPYKFVLCTNQIKYSQLTKNFLYYNPQKSGYQIGSIFGSIGDKSSILLLLFYLPAS